ncbi:hypothetical protein B0A48_06558 [Cryoendolithus antarcticus]|uniref:Uncharacterized protein n=1 Tax=Cryoendolithus antarcticus TaxID=1507870 RepID=A0A1V8TBR1_9PEZI|nr:hypothetical protein B0A48_06558 [Cryoendolithus antarcticus]
MLLSARLQRQVCVPACQHGRPYATNVKPPPPPPRSFGTSPHHSTPVPDAPSLPPMPADGTKPEPLDLARGYAATMRVAREGVLDRRYRPAARRVTAIICAVPVLLVTSWVLYKRQFLGEEQKMLSKLKSAEEIVEGSPPTALDEQAIFPADHDENFKT